MEGQRKYGSSEVIAPVRHQGIWNGAAQFQDGSSQPDNPFQAIRGSLAVSSTILDPVKMIIHVHSYKRRKTPLANPPVLGMRPGSGTCQPKSLAPEVQAQLNKTKQREDILWALRELSVQVCAD